MKIQSICMHVGEGKNAIEVQDFMAKFALDKYEIQIIYCCSTKQLYDYHKSKGNKCLYIAKYLDDELDDDTKSELIQFNQSLGIIDFKEIYFTELIFNYETRQAENYLKDKACKYLKFAKEIIESNFSPDCFVDFAGDEIKHNIFKIIAKSKNSLLIRYRETVFPERLGLMNNDLGIWTIPHVENIIPSHEELDYITNFKEKYLSTQKVFWGDPRDRDFKLIKKGTFNISKILSLKKWSTFYISFKRYINKYRTKSIYDSLDVLKGKDYYYFPLHYPLDSQLTFRGKPFRNQLSLAKTIADFIPYGTFLVVKEHPHARGAIRFKELKQIKGNRNIILLDPWVNSHVIIQKAKSVFVINSTVALEAFYQGIPVISFGRNYFTGHKLFEEINSMYDLFNISKNKSKYSSEYLKKKLDVFLINGYRTSLNLSCKSLLNWEISKEEGKVFIEGILSYINKE